MPAKVRLRDVFFNSTHLILAGNFSDVVNEQEPSLLNVGAVWWRCLRVQFVQQEAASKKRTCQYLIWWENPPISHLERSQLKFLAMQAASL